MPTSIHRCLLLLVLAFFNARPARSEDGGSSRDQARAVLALRSAAGQVMETLRSQTSTQQWDTARLADQLADDMLAGDREHRRRADSQARCRIQAEQHQRAALEAALNRAVDAAQARSILPIRREEVLALVGLPWEQEVQAGVSRFMEQQFDAVFREARMKAVERQRQEALVNLRYPAIDELDPRLLERWQTKKDPAARLEADDFNVLDRWLAAYSAPASEHLLEETEKALREAAAGRKDEIRRQYTHQLDVVDRQADTLSRDVRSAPSLAQLLRRELDGALREQRMAAAEFPPLYPAFQVVSSNIWAIAEEVERQRLTAYWDDQGQPAAEAEILRKEILRDPARHRRRDESGKLLVQELAGPARQAAARALSRAGAGPETDPVFWENRLSGDAPAARAFRARWQQAVQSALPAVRESIRQQQHNAFQALLPGSAPLDEAVLGRLQERSGKLAQTLEEAWVLLHGNQAVRPPSTNLLEETETQLLEEINQGFAAAWSALQEQAALVRELERDGRAQLAKDVAADRPVDQLVKAWTTDFAHRWKERAKPPYLEPLPSTRDLINKTVRQLYDAQKKQQEAEQSAVAATPAPASAALSPSEQQRDEPDRKEDRAETQQATIEEMILVPCDASLVIRDVADRQCEAVLQADPDQPPVSVRFAPDQPEEAARALFDALRPSLTGLAENRREAWQGSRRSLLGWRRKAPPELRFYMVVLSREIRHQTSLMLRSEIRDLLQAWSESQNPALSVSLDWTVGLGVGAARE